MEGSIKFKGNTFPDSLNSLQAINLFLRCKPYLLGLDENKLEELCDDFLIVINYLVEHKDQLKINYYILYGFLLESPYKCDVLEIRMFFAEIFKSCLSEEIVAEAMLLDFNFFLKSYDDLGLFIKIDSSPNFLSFFDKWGGWLAQDKTKWLLPELPEETDYFLTHQRLISILIITELLKGEEINFLRAEVLYRGISAMETIRDIKKTKALTQRGVDKMPEFVRIQDGKKGGVKKNANFGLLNQEAIRIYESNDRYKSMSNQSAANCIVPILKKYAKENNIPYFQTEDGGSNKIMRLIGKYKKT